MVEVTVAGRIMLLRRQGRLTFATIRDRDEAVQLFVSRGVIGEEATLFRLLQVLVALMGTRAAASAGPLLAPVLIARMAMVLGLLGPRRVLRGICSPEQAAAKTLAHPAGTPLPPQGSPRRAPPGVQPARIS